METMHVSLPHNLTEFVVAQVSQGGYSSVSEYLGALIRADQIQKAKAVIESEVLKGLESGPSVPMTPKEWEDLRRQVREQFEARNNI